MIEPGHRDLLDGRPCLPWVPDLVGASWRAAGELVVVGASYAGFIREYSTRHRSMTVSDAAVADMATFQGRFLGNVVDGDDDYYGPIAKLVGAVTNSKRIVVMDLARVSLVRRGAGGPEARGDVARVCASDVEARILADHAECPESMSWSWARFTESPGRSIVAVGSTAEHGVLRLFAMHRCSIRCSDRQDSSRIHREGLWPRRHAKHKLCHWIAGDGRWWQVTSEDESGSWRVLPVYHPARYGAFDPRWNHTHRVLERMFRS